MSKAELLQEFAKLSPADRNELWEALWTLEERDLLGVNAPTAAEKRLLDQEMDDYRKEPHAGSPWSEVETRLREKP